jgi:hypothetical protein
MSTEPSSTSAAAAEASSRGTHRRKGGRDRGRRLLLAAIPVGLLASGFLVFQASNAAFTAQTTSNAAFTTGDVVLTNSASSGITITGLTPGTSGSQCIDVTYAGNLSADVKFYLTNYSSVDGSSNPNNLGQYVQIKVQETNNNKDCAGTPTYGAGTTQDLKTWTDNVKDWATGTAAWGGGQAATNDKHAFKVTWTLPDCGTSPAFGAAGCPADQAAWDTLQGATASATITWEAHNH